MGKYIDSVVVIVGGGEEGDGYVYSWGRMNGKDGDEWGGRKGWEKVEEVSDEFYNLGEMVEGGIGD